MDWKTISSSCSQMNEEFREGSKRLKLSYETYKKVTSAKKYAETDWKQQQRQERPELCTFVHLVVRIFLSISCTKRLTKWLELSNEREDDFLAQDFALLDALLSKKGKGFSIEDKRRDEVDNIFNKKMIFIGLSAPISVMSVATGIENEEEKQCGPLKHCCPWILVEILGQEIGLSGAVFADGVPCIQPLTCNVPFLHAPMGKHLRTSQLRLCKALWVGAGLLREWYHSPERSNFNDQAQYPYIRKYTDDTTGNEVFFEYKAFLKNSVGSVFLAKIEGAGDSDIDIIVKFVEFYGEEVHRKLLDEDMSPQLHAVQQETFNMFKMVVMSYESGARIWNPDVDGVDENKKSQLQNILQKLEQQDFVHGDLRQDNLLVCSNGAVKLIDFDWAGKGGVARYPVELNPEASWHGNASVGNLILIEHDQYMAGRLIA